VEPHARFSLLILGLALLMNCNRPRNNPMDVNGQAFDSNYYDLHRTAQPVFTPGEGTYSNKVTVRISCPTAGAKIYYKTSDMEMPTYIDEYASSYPSNFSLTFTRSAYVRTFAVGSNTPESAVATSTYIITFQSP